MDKLNIDDEKERIKETSEAADQITCKIYFNLMNMARSLPELYQSALRFSKASEVAGEAGMEFFTNLKNTCAYVQGSTCDNQLIDFMMTFTKNLCIVQNLHNEMLRSLMLKMSFAESRLEGEYNHTLNDFAEYDKMGAQTHSKLYQGKWDGSTSSINTIDSEEDVLSFRAKSLRKALMHEHVMMFDSAYLIRYFIDRYRRFCIDAEPYLIGIFDLQSIVENNLLLMNRSLDDPHVAALPNFYAGMSELKHTDPTIQKRLARVDPLDFKPGLKTITSGYIDAARRGPAIALQVFKKWEDPVRKDPYGYDDKKIERDILTVLGEEYFVAKRRRKVQKYSGDYSSHPISDHTITDLNIDKLAQLRERNEALRRLAMEKELGVSERKAASDVKVHHITDEMTEAARMSKLKEATAELSHQEALRLAEQEEKELLAKIEAARLDEENAALLAQQQQEASQRQLLLQAEQDAARISEEQLHALQKVESVKFTESQLIGLQQQKSVKLTEGQISSIIEQQSVPLTKVQSKALEKTKSVMLDRQSSSSALTAQQLLGLQINESLQTDTLQPPDHVAATQVSSGSVSESDSISEQAAVPAKKGFWAKLFKGKNKQGKDSRKSSVGKDAKVETKTINKETQDLSAESAGVTGKSTQASSETVAHVENQNGVEISEISLSQETSKRKQSLIQKIFKSSGDKSYEAGISIQDISALCSQANVRMFRITVNRDESKEWFEFIGDSNGIPYVTPVLFNELPLNFAKELVY